MTITICGSMEFHHQMRAVRTALEKQGYTVLVPKDIELMDKHHYVVPDSVEEKITHKIEYDFIREHFRKIEKSDAILVLNYEKNDVPNYIGGNTFLEMGLAFWLGKPIFLLNPIPDMEYKTEMHAMQPIILNGDLSLIPQR